MRKRHQEDDLIQHRGIAGPLFNEPSPFDASLTEPVPLEEIVAAWVWKHQGRRNPISIASLETITGHSSRAIKGVVEQLRVTRRMPIGAGRDDPPGYFWIVDAEDQAAAVRPYKAQILSMWRTLRIIDSKSSLRELLGQLRMEE